MKAAIAALRDEADVVEREAADFPPLLGGNRARARARLLRLVADWIEVEHTFATTKDRRIAFDASERVGLARAAVAAWKEEV
jgi:hypothetical protein